MKSILQPNNEVMSFPQFMNYMKGKNPREILNSLVSSGKISQQDLNIAQQKANELKDQFEEFRSMFGF